MPKDKKSSKMSENGAKSSKKSEKKQFIALEQDPSVKEGEKETSGIKTTPYSSNRAVVYMSHLPHGMYEKQLREYLGQFGSITNLRLGRSRKTGASKGYAFVEFKYPEVAEIVVETMNNYLMFDKLVKASIVPKDRVKKAIFKGKVNPDNPPLKKARYLAKKQVNAKRTDEQNNKRLRKQLKKLEKVKAKLESAGLNVKMEFDGIRESLPAIGKTPVMEVDEDDLDITMKTPPNVKKVMSRGNSAFNSASGTPSSKGATPKRSMKKKEVQPRDLIMQAVADKLKGSHTPMKAGGIKGTPSIKPKSNAASPMPSAGKKVKKHEEQKFQTPVSEKRDKKMTPKGSPMEVDTPSKSGKKVKGSSPGIGMADTPAKKSKGMETPKSKKKSGFEKDAKAFSDSPKPGTPFSQKKMKPKTPKSGKKQQKV